MQTVWRRALALLGFVTLTFVALAASADNKTDTVFLQDGGRVRGEVMVDDSSGVQIKLADGTSRKIPRASVARVQYADEADTQIKKPEVEEPAAEPTANTQPKAVKRARKSTYQAPIEDDYAVREERREARQKSIRKKNKRMVAAGGFFTVLGGLGTVIGVGLMLEGIANEETHILPGGVIWGFSLPGLIMGSAILGVGSSRLRRASGYGELPDPTTFASGPSYQSPTLELTFSF
ncbi:MAG: hypothetical protein U0271_46270 [Polyangiaceae bacterium]